MSELTKDFTQRTPNGRTYVDPQSFVNRTEAATFEAKVTFADEVEVDGALNHDGTTLGLLGATPVTQRTHIADPSGGLTADTQARAAINAILDLLEAFGLMAP